MRMLLFSLLLVTAAYAADTPKAPLLAGAATSNITPLLGTAIIGGFLPIPAVNVHDELHARCLVLDDGQTKLALVVVELLGIGDSVSIEARKLIEKETGIPSSNVLISAIHTHSAASALGTEFKSPQKADGYQLFVARRIADGVKCAANRLRPAEVGFATAQAPEHVFNRRWFLKSGAIPNNPFGGSDQVKMNPPAGSPDLLKPAGPTDPTVSILSVREPGGRPIAVYSAYSLHYVGGVKHGDISADYCGMYCRRLERLMHGDEQDPPMVAMMANGTSADVNNIDFIYPRPPRKPYEQMRFVADDLAGKVRAALASIKYHDRITLAARYRELKISPRKPTAEQMAWARQTLARPEPAPGKADLPRIYAQRTVDIAGYPTSIPVALQVLRIGEVCIGSMPNEVFSEIGLEFRMRSQVQPAFLVELAHGYFGYLPTPKQHELGGYETWLGTNHLEPLASDKMLDALLEMTAEVRPATAEQYVKHDSAPLRGQ
ncbi:MAG TPA: neutral/alkaline non-lysosomal ceramidase N-terminal domain-containing protein [Verrucomicrobiae bacterium]|nr:neutral/alkaline non-lysosomal ceramidase N-terminal domain-containing protein [Verrucomicrobiae bacterium]